MTTTTLASKLDGDYWTIKSPTRTSKKTYRYREEDDQDDDDDEQKIPWTGPHVTTAAAAAAAVVAPPDSMTIVEFPAELLSEFCEFVKGDIRSLANLALSCTQFAGQTQPILKDYATLLNAFRTALNSMCDRPSKYTTDLHMIAHLVVFGAFNLANFIEIRRDRMPEWDREEPEADRIFSEALHYALSRGDSDDDTKTSMSSIEWLAEHIFSGSNYYYAVLANQMGENRIAMLHILFQSFDKKNSNCFLRYWMRYSHHSVTATAETVFLMLSYICPIEWAPSTKLAYYIKCGANVTHRGEEVEAHISHLLVRDKYATELICVGEQHVTLALTEGLTMELVEQLHEVIAAQDEEEES